MTTATYNMIDGSELHHKSGNIMKLCAFPHSTRNFLFKQFTVHVRNVFGFFLYHAFGDSSAFSFFSCL